MSITHLCSAGDAIAETNSSRVDLRQLYEALGDEPAELYEVLDLYLSQIPESLDRLNAAITTGDAEEVCAIAHNCAGSSASCGTAALVGFFRELERAGREACLDDAMSVLTRARREFSGVRQFLETHLEMVPV